MLDFDPAYVHYPDSDGKPMTEGDRQGNAIRLLMTGFRWLYRFESDIHVSGDVMWYPVQGNPRISAAPDVMVIEACARDQEVGRYVAWEHGGLAPSFVIEVLSPTNTAAEMLDKLAFYERHGVGEYVLIDPFQEQIRAWVRRGGVLVTELVTGPWTSPFCSVTFSYDEGLNVFGPDRRRWLPPEQELLRANTEAERARAEAERANTEAVRANTEAERAQTESARADLAEKELATLRTELAELRGQR